MKDEKMVNCADFLFHDKYSNAMYLKPVDNTLRNWPLQ